MSTIVPDPSEKQDLTSALAVDLIAATHDENPDAPLPMVRSGCAMPLAEALFALGWRKSPDGNYGSQFDQVNRDGLALAIWQSEEDGYARMEWAYDAADAAMKYLGACPMCTAERTHCPERADRGEMS